MLLVIVLSELTSALVSSGPSGSCVLSWGAFAETHPGGGGGHG